MLLCINDNSLLISSLLIKGLLNQRAIHIINLVMLDYTLFYKRNIINEHLIRYSYIE